MPVEKDGGLPRSQQRLGIDERVQVRRNDLNGLESGIAQVVGNPASTSFDVRLVFALGADARDAQKLRQFGKVLVAATFDECSKVCEGHQGLQVLSKAESHSAYAKLETMVAAADDS